MADDGGGGLLRVELPRRLLADRYPDAVGAQELGALGVVLQVGTGRVTPGVTATPVLLAEQAAERRAVLADEAPFFPNAAMPVFGQGFGHLDAQAVQVEVVLVAVLGKKTGRLVGGLRSHGYHVEGGVVGLP